MHNSSFEKETALEIEHPFLDQVQEFIRRAFPKITFLSGPTEVYANYNDGPDRRATLSFSIDDPDHRKVVVKVNRFPLLKGSATAHRLVHRCAPLNVPRVLDVEDYGNGSIIILAMFEGQSVETISDPKILCDMAKTLARIQIDCAQESANTTGLDTISPTDLPDIFDQCLGQIEAHFDAWKNDDGKIARAMGFPSAEVLGQGELLRTKVGAWVQILDESGVDLSIEHGDCHAGNAVWLEDDSVLIFDWENACRSHPFLSAEKILTSGWGFDTVTSGGPWGYVRNTPIQDHIKAAYLSEYGLPNTKLQRAFDAAMCLAVIKEMHHEMEWARLCGWKDLNPEWTAQLFNRLFQHAGMMDK